MNIVFYSTNSNSYNPQAMRLTSFPSNMERLKEFAAAHSEHKIFAAPQLPGMFLLDPDSDGNFKKAENVSYYIIRSQDAEDAAEEIASLSPDIAIAFSFWTAPYDWLTVCDAHIGEILRTKGIKVLCHSVDCALTFFDKNTTHKILEPLGFLMPRSVFVHHELFFKTGKTVAENVYRKTVLYEIKKLNFPVVIKDTTGLSSYGMDVVNTYEEAEKILLSKRNNADRLVEEFIQGIQFGTEIYGKDGHYKILPPLAYSVNKYGLTSPKQSIKLGPVRAEKFKLNKLYASLKKLASAMNFSGNVQVDLVFTGTDWYLIEVNPRLSGSTELYSCYENRSVFERLFSCAVNDEINDADFSDDLRTDEFSEKEIFMNYKVALLSKEQIAEIKKLPFVKYVRQVENLFAKQIRETGYCEIVFSSGSGTYMEQLDSIKNHLKEISAAFPEIIEPVFFERADALIDICRE